MSLLAGAPQRKSRACRARARRQEAPGEARGAAGAKPLTPDSDDAGSLRRRTACPPPSATAKDAGGGGVVEAKTLDGGTRVFRFGEVEVEGRLEPANGLLPPPSVLRRSSPREVPGHRGFVGELKETRNSRPGF